MMKYRALSPKKADKDSILTEEDYRAVLDYRLEKAKGKLVLNKDFKKELGL